MNNRKLIQGFYRGLGIPDVTAAIRQIDKLDKLPEEAVVELLVEHAGATDDQARRCLELATIRVSDHSLVDRVQALGVTDELLSRGLAELASVLDGCADVVGDRVTVEANLRIARGLDYYTGTVVEIYMAGYERLKAVGGGGRYDALADDGRTTYPGVGISFGVSRALVPLIHEGVLDGSRAVPSAVLVALADEESRPASERIAAALRGRGIATEVAPTPQKYGRQIRYAERRGIPFVWFPASEPGGSDQVKDIRSGDQVDADSADLGATRGRSTTHDHHRREAGEDSVIRTHDAGTLTAADEGTQVVLAGWVARRRDHGGVAFIDLREASGVVQVVIRDESVAHSLRSEYCLKIVGTVHRRPEGNANPDIATGEIEVIADDVDVLNPSAVLPFPIDDAGSQKGGDVGEEARLRHRYLDLRRSGPATAIRLRSRGQQGRTHVLDGHGFVEIETPTLTRSTPEGARDFLVPARLQPGSWYALPQSPQLFKQLLMVAGMERYYQIARCYRDEDFRADRQPEFTQLDLEMSFVDQDDVLAIAEDVLVSLWRLIGHEVPTPLTRMTYAEAMARFGSDKPDLRMGQELVDCTAYFAQTEFRVFQAPYVGAVVMPGGADQPRRQFDAWQEWAKQRGARGLAYVTVGDDGELGGPVAKNLSEEERAGLADHTGAKRGDCIFFAAGPAKSSRALLGAARLEIGRQVRTHRRGRVELPLGRRRAAVRAGRRGDGRGRRGGRQRRLDGGPPRVHLAAGPRDLRPGARAGAGLGLRHRVQRQRDRRWLHPYPPPRRPGAGLRGDGPRRGGGAGEVRLPPRRLPVRRASARWHRVRLGSDRRPAVQVGLDP